MVKLRLCLQRPHVAKLLYPIALVAVGIGGLGVLADIGGLRSSVVGRVNAAETREVVIDNYKFAPADLTVPVGTTVTWVNHDEEVHTVTAADQPQSFKSAGLDTDDKFSFTFNKPGTYSYFCSIHSYMTAKIIVR
jgi:plastocyanin